MPKRVFVRFFIFRGLLTERAFDRGLLVVPHARDPTRTAFCRVSRRINTYTPDNYSACGRSAHGADIYGTEGLTRQRGFSALLFARLIPQAAYRDRTYDNGCSISMKAIHLEIQDRKCEVLAIHF